MTIWKHEPHARRDPHVTTLVGTRDCPYCEAELSSLVRDVEEVQRGDSVHRKERFAKACRLCGWWTAGGGAWVIAGPHGTMGHRWTGRSYGGVATLKALDLTDLSLPVEEIRKYLIAKYDRRFELEPRAFEQTVGSVLRDCGYPDVVVTGYQNDGGIDVICRGVDGVVGVQVKRYRDKIGVAQIREFVGAMIDSAVPRGIFVTTSEFTKGALGLASRMGERGHAVELVNAPTFYDALRITQRPAYRNGADLLSVVDLESLPTVATLDGY